MKFTIRRDSNSGRGVIKAGATKTRGKNKSFGRQPKHPAARVFTYHAVTIASGAKKCAAAENLCNQAFLSNQAPMLPLPDCENPRSCCCKYHHLDDRRGEMRRDTDYGLPERRYDAQDRRSGPDTRRSA